MDQKLQMNDSLLLLEFDCQKAQLVPCGRLYSIRYGHCLSFYGFENLVEKLKRIYFLLGISQDSSGYPSAFSGDGPFFVSEKCLSGKEQWYSGKEDASGMLPEHWESCLMIRSLDRRENCWQGVLIAKNRQWHYNSSLELTECLSQFWLQIKRKEYGLSGGPATFAFHEQRI